MVMAMTMVMAVMVAMVVMVDGDDACDHKYGDEIHDVK